MVETSPIMMDAFELLRYDLYEHLDEAEALALGNNCWSEEQIDSAYELIPHMVAPVRKLVIDHKDDPNGQCVNCGAVWPCSVVRTIHDVVKDPKGEFVKLVSQARAARIY